MTKVKICGIRNLQDAIFAVDYGADALGFVFAQSIRKVSKEKARAIVRKLPPFVTTVGLFVNETVENIEAACRFCGLDAIQLHGNEPPDIINKLRARLFSTLLLGPNRPRPARIKIQTSHSGSFNF